MNNNQNSSSPLHRFAPAVSALPERHHRELFEGAPFGTLVEVNGELYKRGFGNVWMELESVVSGDGFSRPAEHNECSNEELLLASGRRGAQVRVLRVGEESR